MSVTPEAISARNLMDRARLAYACSFDIEDRTTEQWWDIRDDAFKDFDAAAKVIEARAKAEAWDAVIARIDLGTPYMVDEKYVAGAEWVRNQITDVLRARAATIEGKSA